MAVKIRQREPVQFSTDHCPQFQTEPFRKARHKEALKCVQNPGNCINHKQDDDLSSSALPGHSERSSFPPCLPDLPPQQVNNPGTVKRRRHRKYSIKQHRYCHDYQTYPLFSHDIPEPFHSFRGIGWNRVFHLIFKYCCIILLHPFPLLSSANLQSAGKHCIFPSVPHVFRFRLSSLHPEQ